MLKEVLLNRAGTLTGEDLTMTPDLWYSRLAGMRPGKRDQPLKDAGFDALV
jgi:hypothetical protein